MYKTGVERILYGKSLPYESLSRLDLLYVVFGVAVKRALRDSALCRLGLAPMTVYPYCDWCSGCSEQGHGMVHTYPDLRWAFHEDCRAKALHEAPNSSGLPPFTNWMTQDAYMAFCRKIIPRVGSIADILNGNHSFAENELRVAFKEWSPHEEIEEEGTVTRNRKRRVG